jgi:hypothetical protein
MRRSRRLTLRRLTLSSCLLLCCALAASDFAPAGVSSAAPQATAGGAHEDPLTLITRNFPRGALVGPPLLGAASPLRALMPGGTPYTGAPLAIPGTIQAEDFDQGGRGRRLS